MTPRIVGRSSSHYTRVVRMFALECGVKFEFEPVLDLMSLRSADYAGHPALKLPILLTEAGPHYGSLHICQTLHVMAEDPPAVRWPWDLAGRLAGNAAELVQQAMATEVQIVVNRLSGVDDTSPMMQKALAGMRQSLAWLDENSAAFLRPDSPPGYLDLALFCLLTHIPFRQVMNMDPLPNLDPWRESLTTRPSAVQTGYRFDPA